MKVLVANRGEIACRILRTLREMGVPSVAVLTAPDREAPHAELGDETVELGPPDRYLDPAAILEAARRTGATAVHPGYGFLSQSASFARACHEAGLVFIGPTPESMAALGDKAGARRSAEALGIPVVPGVAEIGGLAAAEGAAARLGYPVLLKPAGGGGGKGMRLVLDPAGLKEAHEAARREAQSSFADDRLVLEKHIRSARHVEVQIVGDGKRAVALGERECSLQRRYQKVIEEGPAPRLPDAARRSLCESAVKLAQAAGYRSAGTVEFLVGADGAVYFLEVNTRLQVEHPVTEALTGLDLVRIQVELAQGAPLPDPPAPRGHAIEARLNAEDPYRSFLPQAGRVLMLEWPHAPGVRVDAGVRESQEVGTHYDPLLAKIIAWGGTRETARRRLIEALRGTTLLGVVTNQSFLIQVLESGFFVAGDTPTTALESATWTEPPVPEEAAAAATRLLSSRPQTRADGCSDSHSPWDSLGPFRVGR